MVVICCLCSAMTVLGRITPMQLSRRHSPRFPPRRLRAFLRKAHARTLESSNLNTIDSLLLIGGGVPVKVGSEVIGAIGVGGAGGSVIERRAILWKPSTKCWASPSNCFSWFRSLFNTSILRNFPCKKPNSLSAACCSMLRKSLPSALAASNPLSVHVLNLQDGLPLGGRGT